VIGAGACGLAAAKKLLDQGLTPVVYERNAEAGGARDEHGVGLGVYGVPDLATYSATKFFIAG
jgi:cation diffusion facilitator CzcD-associated flavoprotein CzcO